MKSSRDLFLEAREEEMQQDMLFMEADQYELERLWQHSLQPVGRRIYTTGLLVPWWKKIRKKKADILPF